MKVLGSVLVALLALAAFDYHRSNGKYVGTFVQMAKQMGAQFGSRH